MAIRKYKPTSAGRRFQTVQTFDDITTDTQNPPPFVAVAPLRADAPAAAH